MSNYPCINPPPPSPPRPSTLAFDRAPLLKPWSAKDEAELRDAQRRIDEAQTRRALAREAVARALTVESDSPPRSEFVDFCVLRAEAIRDALAPFDSGVRAA